MAPLLQGKLSNGFRYVIKENSLPSNKIYFRLVLGVGSIDERADEKGVAHFIEHMAFHDTSHFPKDGIVRQLESLGEKYGESINAYTGYDRTVYMFSIPSSVPNAIELGVDIAKEWLSNVTFDEATVQKEKKIICEEIGGYRSPDCLELLKKGTNPALHRFPMGSAEDVHAIDAKVLRAFYARNYRPHNASLIIVGAGFDAQQVEKTIEKTFSTLNDNVSEKELQPLTYDASTAFEACLSDGKLSSVEWIYPVKAVPVLTTEQKVAEAQRQFVLSMINTRLRKRNSPLRLYRRWYLGATEHFGLTLDAPSDSLLLKGLREGVAIIEGIRQNGFSDHEVKMQLRSFQETCDNDSFDLTSQEWCDHFIDMLLVKSVGVLSEPENKIVASALEAVDINQWNRIMTEVLAPMAGNTPLIGYRHPVGRTGLSQGAIVDAFNKGRLSPDNGEIISLEVTSREHCPYDDAFLNKPFTLRPLSIKSENYYPHLKLTEIVLNNGATLLLRPTANEEKSLSVSMLFSGGLAEIPREKYAQLESVASYLSLGGIDGIDDENYDNALSLNGLSIINTMELHWHGIMARGGSDKLSQIAQLIFQRCFSPKRCYEDFDEIMNDARDELEELALRQEESVSPDRLLADRKNLLAGNTLPYACELTLADIDSLDLDALADYYRHIYTRSTGLYCIVTGNFDINQAKSCFLQMLSRFEPQQTLCAHAKPVDPQKLSPEEKVATTSASARVAFDYLYLGSFPSGLRSILTLKLMREILLKRLIDELRNRDGLIYSPYVVLERQASAMNAFCIDINGEADAAHIAQIKLKIEAIVDHLAHQPVDVGQLDAIKRSFLLTKENTLTEKAFMRWNEYLTTNVKDAISFDDADHYESLLSAISPEEIRQAFSQWLPPSKKTFLYIGSYEKDHQ